MSDGALSKAQRELLAEFVNGPNDDRYITPQGRRTARALVERGLLRWSLSHGWAVITPEGKRRQQSRPGSNNE